MSRYIVVDLCANRSPLARALPSFFLRLLLVNGKPESQGASMDSEIVLSSFHKQNLELARKLEELAILQVELTDRGVVLGKSVRAEARRF